MVELIGAQVFQQANLLRARRAEPVPTARGKLFPYIRRPASEAGLVLLAVALLAPEASGQGANVTLYACRRLYIRQIQAGTQVNYSQCGGQFTTADRYIAVVVHLRNVRQGALVLAELRDPDQAVVWRGAGLAAPPSGADVYFSDFWVIGVLPVDANAGAVIAENPALARFVANVSGKPARERVGEWTLRADVNNTVSTLKFQLQAAPGAPTPAPTPTPAPAPTPEDTPSP